MNLQIEGRTFVNPYIRKMDEYKGWILPEDLAKNSKGKWKSEVFSTERPLHIEIGTGNGIHFAHYAKENPEVALVGFEIKFKTLVQSISRARSYDCQNAKMVLGPVKTLTEYFGDNEAEKIIIHFPDPWPKVRQQKNRLFSEKFVKSAFEILKPGGVLEFKTDHFGYFLAARAQIAKTNFQLISYSEDLHQSPWASQNFKTQFEDLFLKKGQPIFYFALKK
jgi:tRNA (guanine-N7-)-methyltransferase